MKSFLGLATMVISAFSIAAAVPSIANAACKVYSALPVRTEVISATNVGVIYFRPHVIEDGSVAKILTNTPALSSTYWVASVALNTKDGAAVFSAATNAVEHQTKIMIYGDAATCPPIPATATSATVIGNVTILVVNP